MWSGERLIQMNRQVLVINTRETYPDDGKSVKQIRSLTCATTPEMKSVLCKYKCTIASHITFTLLAMFLAQKINNTKNSKAFLNLETEEWSSTHTQASFKV